MALLPTLPRESDDKDYNNAVPRLHILRPNVFAYAFDRCTPIRQISGGIPEATKQTVRERHMHNNGYLSYAFRASSSAATATLIPGANC